MPRNRPYPPAHAARALLQCLYAVGLLFAATQATADQQPPCANAACVTVKDGHLSRQGKRLRLWGVNLQSGVFTSYGEIDRLIDRLRALGFNAIRVWPTAETFYTVDPKLGTVPAESRRGDGSALDRFDYLIARAAAADLSVEMTMLHYFGLPALRGMQDPAIASWVSAAGSDLALRRIMSFAPYVSKPWRDQLKAHMGRVLNRVNPYTGRRYADEPAVGVWELANEASFVGCSLARWCLYSMPSVARETLAEEWQKSPLNPDGSALPFGVRSLLETDATRRFRQFVAERFIDVSKELMQHARSAGGPASAVAVQPFIFSTGQGDTSAVVQYAHGAGDVAAAGIYHSPIVKAGDGLQGTTWQPMSMGGPRPELAEFTKEVDKPLVIYETSFVRPYAFRAEWGPVVAAMALRQDWDAVFFYTYGQPRFIYTEEGRPEGYGRVALAEPSADATGDTAGYTFGFHQGGDPVAMASWSVGAPLFLQAQGSVGGPRAEWDIPLTTMYSTRSGYGKTLVDAGKDIRQSALRGNQVRFVDAKSPRCEPCLSDTPANNTIAITWNDGRGPLQIETPGGKAVVGMLQGRLPVLAPWLNVDVAAPEFGVYAAVAGAPGQKGGTRVYLIGQAENTGWTFDPTAGDRSNGVGMHKGVSAPGRAPVVFHSPRARLTLDRDVEGTDVDFGLRRTPLPAGTRTLSWEFSSAHFYTDWAPPPASPVGSIGKTK